mgnify:FL=1
MTMTSSPPRAPQGSGRRHLLPPLATALVFVIFAALFCIFALMDLRRVETLLLTVLQNRAVATVHALEKTSQENYRRLRQKNNDSLFIGSLGLVEGEDDFSQRELLAHAILALAHSLDLQAHTHGLTSEGLERIVEAEHLQGIIIWNGAGEIIGQSGTVVPALEQLLTPLWRGQDEVAMQLFDQAADHGPTPFLALRRQAGDGIVLLILGRAGLDFWERRLAVQEALLSLPRGPDLAYVSLTTPAGHLLAQAGQGPEQHLGQCQLLSPARGGQDLQASFCTLAGGSRVLELAMPLRWSDGLLGTARVGVQTYETDTLLRENRRHIFLWTGVMLGIGFLATVLLYLFQERYLARLQIMRERLQQAERLSAFGRLAAGVAHEVRNPLNAISIAVQRLRREFLPPTEARQPDFLRLTQVLREEITRLNTIVEEFLSLARPGKLDRQPLATNILLEKTTTLYQAAAQAKGVQLQVQVAAACPPVLVDAQKMQQVLINVVKNSLEATSGPGLIQLAAAPAGPDRVRLTITDTGQGMAPEEAAHIFDPYYTTKERGLGLGLALAYEIIRAHGGEITAQSQPGAGTTVTILLPRPTRSGGVAGAAEKG